MNGVAMWDVAAQRQVEISGSGAAQLIQYLTTHDLSKTKVGQGRYVLIRNHAGTLINDPVLLMIGPDQYWLPIADSDIELWASAIAAERGFDVQVFEPDVSLLAIRGPKAEMVVANLFGDWVKSLKHFGFNQTEIQRIPFILARSGWSKQGGFELYLQDGTRGFELWNIVKAAGINYGILAGAPNDKERIESGWVSYGADGRLQTNPCNPFEIALVKLVNFNKEDDFVDRTALLEIKAEGPKRRDVGYVISHASKPSSQHSLDVLNANGEVAVILSEWVYSDHYACKIGVGMIATDIKESAGALTIILDGQSRNVELKELPFFRSGRD